MHMYKICFVTLLIISMTLLQLAHIGRRMNVLENYFIQLFQHNNTMIQYKYWKKERKIF
jgi:hypothetical protein